MKVKYELEYETCVKTVECEHTKISFRIEINKFEKFGDIVCVNDPDHSVSQLLPDDGDIASLKKISISLDGNPYRTYINLKNVYYREVIDDANQLREYIRFDI